MKKILRSQDWFGRKDAHGFSARSWLKNQGHPGDSFEGQPVIGICNTASDLTPCNAHLTVLAERVARGVYQTGGFPLTFSVMSMGENLMRPSTMMYRNLSAMEVEETIRSNPLDAVVLLVGCDKTTPACVMGAASTGLPTIVVSSGPMLTGYYRGKPIGSGTDVIRGWEEVKAGRKPAAELLEAEAAFARSAGTCMTMGTASTMASLMETMGLALPGNGATPAVDARRSTLAHLSGRRIVEMVDEDLTINKVLNIAAFENAVVANAALGGSTNAVVHLQAIAGRLGLDFSLKDWDRFGGNVPCLLDLLPSGKYMMEDFFRAGGVGALLSRVREHLHCDALTVTGKTLGENIASAEVFDDEIIRTPENPILRLGGIRELRGNLAPDGAIIKPSAATPALLTHRGPAVVFQDIDDYRARINDPDLEVSSDSVLVLQNCGPKGYPGFPEVGNMGLPAKLLRDGVSDMVRISDARMSGTAYGTVVLHVAPEAAAGGPLALVENGDIIALDVPNGSLTLEVSDQELARRKEQWVAPPRPERGWERLYFDHVTQANLGADLDVLVGSSGNTPPKLSH